MKIIFLVIVLTTLLLTGCSSNDLPNNDFDIDCSNGRCDPKQDACGSLMSVGEFFNGTYKTNDSSCFITPYDSIKFNCDRINSTDRNFMLKLAKNSSNCLIDANGLPYITYGMNVTGYFVSNINVSDWGAENE